jgi:GNAT superfamily N-acetyltransferase
VRDQSGRSEQFRIRQATADEVPLILRFIRLLAEYEREPEAVVATEESLLASLFGDRPAAEVLFGCSDGEPVAFALFFTSFSTWLGKPGIYLEDLFVLPEQRRKGYGRAMLAHIARLARDRGCGRLEWAVLDWNDPAIAFYRSLGAEAMDEWTTYRLSDEDLSRLADQR